MKSYIEEAGLWVNSLRGIIADWLNGSQRSQVGVGTNRSASGEVTPSSALIGQQD